MTRKRTALVYLTVVLVVVLITTLVVARSGLTRRMVERELAGVFEKGRFAIGDASFDLSAGVLTVEGLSVTTPSTQERGLQGGIDELEIEVELNPLRDLGSIRHVRITRASLDIDLFDGRFPDLASLFIQRDEPLVETKDFPVSNPPSIEMLDSRFSLRLAPNDPALEFETLSLTILPVEDTPGAFGLSGRARGPGGAGTRIEGSIRLSDGEVTGLEIQVTLDQLPLSPASLGPGGRRWSEWAADAGLNGFAESLLLSASLDPETTEWTIRAHTSLREARIRFPDAPLALTGLRGEISGTILPNASLQVDLEGKAGGGRISLAAEAERPFDESRTFRIESKILELPVDESFSSALSGVPEVREVWDGFAPEGGFASLSMIAERGPDLNRMDVRLDLDAVSAVYLGIPTGDGRRTTPFPLPVERVTGPITFDGEKVVIDDLLLSATEGDLRMNGFVEVGDGPLDLRFIGPEMTFSPRVLDALYAVGRSVDQEIGEIYAAFDPTGPTGVDVHVRTPDGQPGTAQPDVSVRLRPDRANVTWDEFPVPLSDVSGRIDILPAGVSLDLTARHNDAALRLEADLGPETDPEALDTDLWLQIERLSTDEKLLSALDTLSPELAKAFGDLDLRAEADLDLAVWQRPGSAAPHFDLRVDVLDGEATLAELGLRATGLNGPVFVRGQEEADRIEIGGLRGKLLDDGASPPAELLIQGLAASKPGQEEDLAAVVRDLPLERRVGVAIDEAGVFDLETWDLIRPAGFVDLVWRSRGEANAESKDELRLQLRSASASGPYLPAPATELQGKVTISDERTLFEDLRGRMAGIEIRCETGEILTDPAGSTLKVRVETEGFRLDEQFANLFLGPFKQTWLDRGVRGRIDLTPLDLEIRFPDDDIERFETRARGTVALRDVAVDLGTEVRELSATIRLNDSAIGPEGGRLRGRFDQGAATLLGTRLTKATADFDLDADRLRLGSLEGELLGGRVTGGDSEDPALEIGVGPVDRPMTAKLGWSGIRLERLLGKGRDLTSRDARSGTLSGTLDLRAFDPDRPIDTRGTGRIDIVDGDLGEVPLFTTIYTNVDPSRRPRFTELGFDFAVGEQRIDVTELKVGSKLLSITGDGQVGMDGYVDMLLRPGFFENASFLILPELIDGATRLHIYGPHRALRSELLFVGSRTQDKVPLGPIPPR